MIGEHGERGAESYQHGELSAEQLRAQRFFLRLKSDDSFFKTRFLKKTDHSRWSQAVEQL